MTYLSLAKINLFLHVVSKRNDGYHNLQTIFQLLNYGDEMEFKSREDGLVNRNYSIKAIPSNKDLVLKSAYLLKELSGTKKGVDISLIKKIPIGGGLGGGSSNAATTLIALNKLWKLNYSKEKLTEIGKTLGSDVPVFLSGKTSWAEGTGELLTPITLPKYFYLVVSINKQISTQEVFAHKALTMSPVQRKMTDFSDVSNLHNDCLDAAIDIEGEIEFALLYLDRTANHLGLARMTGTGCCVFVAFEKEKDALKAKQELPSKWTGFVAQAINKSPL